MVTRWALALWLGVAPAGAIGTIEADGRFDLAAFGSRADDARADARAGVATTTGVGDLALRGCLHGLSVGVRAVRSGPVGQALGRPVVSLRWTPAAETELMAGLLRVHLGAGCLAADGDWDELDPTRAYSPRLLQAATTLSRSTPARAGGLARAALGRWRLAAWWAQGVGGGAGLTATAAGGPALDVSAVALEGVAIGTRTLMLAAVRTEAAAGPWAWSASAALSGRERSGLVLEIAGPLPALRRPAPSRCEAADAAWSASGRSWGQDLGDRIAVVGGRWRLAAGQLAGELDGAFRLLAGLERARAVSPGSEAGTSPAPERFGWRCSWRLPALAGVAPTISLHALQAADGGDGPGSAQRGARLDFAAQPWSGAALHFGLDSRHEDLLRAAASSGQTKDPVRSTTSAVDLEARFLLDGGVSCVLRYRQRGVSQTLDAERAPRLREIVEEVEVSPETAPEQGPAGGSSAGPVVDAPAEPAWLRERSGSVLWFRLAWSGAGPRRGGVGLAAAPQSSSIAALVPARSAPGRTSWRPLAAGAHMAEAWFGVRRGSLNLEAAARWLVPAPGAPPEMTLSLGASWRGQIGARLAAPAMAH